MVLALLLASVDQFRIRLNAPAARLVVGDAPALEIESADGQVRVRPSRSRAAFPLAPRGSETGGLEALISGARALEILSGLGTLSGHQQQKPIFRLEKDSEKVGWYRLRFEPEAPARHIPQLRLWLSTEAPPEPQRVNEEPDWAAEVRRAFALVQAYDAGGRIGRPSKEVAAAQAVVAVFRQLAADLLPPAVDRAAVERARETLDQALKLPA